MINRIRQSMKEYYHDTTVKDWHLLDKAKDERFYSLQKKIWDEMDELYAKNPTEHKAKLKSKLHSLIAENCEVVIFPENPFYYEIGMREANSWGLSGLAPSNWIHRGPLFEVHQKNQIVTELEKMVWSLFDHNQANACSIMSSFDIDHHVLGFRTLFKEGVGGLIERTNRAMTSFDEKSDNYVYCQAILESCNAVLRIAEKFSLEAESLIKTAATESEKQALMLIADTAKRIPKQPPKTFYEGLEMLIFMREITASLENIGISSFGQVDLLLGELYEADLKAGRITEERARELIGIWLIYTDLKFYVEENEWPETSTCLQLGGCDEAGCAVYNAVTRMIIEEHHRLGLINPKLNCRYGKNSPTEYLELMGKAVLAGHNNFVMINDEFVIDGLVKNGVDIADARAYVNGGCQETMIEGCGHTEGAAVYVSMPHILDAFLYEKKGMEVIAPLTRATTFDEFYSQFTFTVKRFLTFIFTQRNIREYYEKSRLFCPLFSATQSGCIESGTDYCFGGAKYNFSTVALLGLATVVDSLYAIKELVYERKLVDLTSFIEILKNDWKGSEELRDIAISLPKYGHANADVDAFASKYLTEIATHVTNQPNERGGRYIPSLFVYYYYQWLSHTLRATPDGRRSNDLMSPGCSPSQLAPVRDAIEVIQSFANMDFSVLGGGNAVFDVMLPMSKQMDERIFAAFIRACGNYGCPTIQPNVVCIGDLIDAKINPDAHRDIIVRISGLSAFFVALNPDVQDEIISRNNYNV